MSRELKVLVLKIGVRPAATSKWKGKSCYCSWSLWRKGHLAATSVSVQ